MSLEDFKNSTDEVVEAAESLAKNMQDTVEQVDAFLESITETEIEPERANPPCS